MARTITLKTKAKVEKKKPKDAQPARTKERRERGSPSCGGRRKLCHSQPRLSNVACMQIMGSNSSRRFKASLMLPSCKS